MKDKIFITDQEIDLRKNDLFDSKHYASTLVDIIKKSPTDPFTIGLFGEWGIGKSSIVTTAQGMLKNEKNDKYHFFTYDAWKYSKDSFRRTFLLNLSQSLNLKTNDLFQSFYESKAETIPIRRDLNWGFLTLAGLMLLGVLLLALISNDQTEWILTFQTILMVIAIVISFAANLTKEYVGTKQNKTQCFSHLSNLSLV